MHAFGIFVKDQVTIAIWSYIGLLYSFPLIYVSDFIAESLDYNLKPCR